jgi:hypothetical protein
MAKFLIATAFSPLVFDGRGQVPAETLPANSIWRRAKGRRPKTDTTISIGAGWWANGWPRVEDFHVFRGETASRAVVPAGRADAPVGRAGARVRWLGQEGAILVARVTQRRIWHELRTGERLSERRAAAQVARKMHLPPAQGPARYFEAKRTDLAKRMLTLLLPALSADSNAG